MSRPIVLATLVDAWRHDRCTPEDTPFLDALAKARGALKEPFGFNTGPAMFGGVYPEVSNQIQKFWFEPELSPFAFTRYIPEFLMHLPRGSGRLNNWIFDRAEATLRARGVTAAKHLVDFQGVPHVLRRFFNLVETKNHHEPGCLSVPTIFDVLRNTKRSFQWIGVPDNQLTVAANLADFRRDFVDQDLVFIHWSETDWIGHASGPDGPEYRAKLKEIDHGIEEVVQTLRATGRPVRVLAYGDHGMVPVTGGIDVVQALGGLASRCPDDYVYFLDSTAARFWFFHDRAKGEVTRRLTELPQGRFVTEADHAAYRLPRGDRRHWDACWMLEEGYVIRPDFFHTDLDHPVRGMHGYRPEVPGNQASWVVGGDVTATPRSAAARDMVDVATTILNLLELEVPATFQGQGLVQVKVQVKV